MMGKDAASDMQRRTVFNRFAGDRMTTVSYFRFKHVFKNEIVICTLSGLISVFIAILSTEIKIVN
jgi:hypothetical protein